MRYRGALATSVLGFVALVTLSGCSTQALVSSWKAPDASPFQLKGEKVAAIVMTTDLPTRRAGEDALARQLSLHGVEGVSMYTLLSDPDPDEAKARAAAEQAHVVGVVVIRPVRIDKELSSSPATYSGPMYGGFWGATSGADVDCMLDECPHWMLAAFPPNADGSLTNRQSPSRTLQPRRVEGRAWTR